MDRRKITCGATLAAVCDAVEGHRGWWSVLSEAAASVQRVALVAICAPMLAACGGCACVPDANTASTHAGSEAGERVRFAIAIHGGAGVIDQATTTPQQRADYASSLRNALQAGRDVLASGGSSLEACELVVRLLEDDPKFNAGRGAVYTEVGTHELDAAIMDGASLRAGAVLGVRTVRNPISLARLVMQRTPHIMLAGDGAERFADECSDDPRIARVPNSFFDTPHRYEALQKALQDRAKSQSWAPTRAEAYRGTVGCVALDQFGNVAAATSTGGMTAKRWGRVGDSPVIGAGTYANNRTCAVSCTGTGEQFIRHTVARDIAALMEYKGLTARAAAEQLVFRTLDPDDGGVIVVSRTGEIAMVFSTAGMFRGAADSTGRFEVAIWKEHE